MDGLLLRDFHAVAAVAALRHFGRAADSLHIAQPTLSSQVQKVEAALGSTLFERTGRRFLTTPAGERVLPMIHELLVLASRMESRASSISDPRRRPLRVGIIPTLGPYLIPHLLPAMKAMGGDGTFSISEHPTASLLHSLQEGTLDAALVSLPIRVDSLECMPLFEEVFRFIAPRGHSLACGDRLVPAKLCACDMVLLEDGHCLRDQAISLCNRRGGSTPRLVAASLETLKYLVAAGEGYSLLPQLACELSPELSKLVEVRVFDERAPVRRIALCTRNSSPLRDQIAGLAELIRRHLPPGVAPIQHPASTRAAALDWKGVGVKRTRRS